MDTRRSRLAGPPAKDRLSGAVCAHRFLCNSSTWKGKSGCERKKEPLEHCSIDLPRSERPAHLVGHHLPCGSTVAEALRRYHLYWPDRLFKAKDDEKKSHAAHAIRNHDCQLIQSRELLFSLRIYIAQRIA